MKLAPHIFDGSADAKKLAKYSPAIKLIGGYDKASEYKQENRSLFVWGRVVYGPDELWRTMPPDLLYYNYMRQHITHPANQLVIGWETINEDYRKSKGETPDYADMGLRANYESVLAELIYRDGKIPILGHLPVGTPSGTFDEQKKAWRNYQEALYTVNRYKGYMAIHAYGNVSGWTGPLDALIAVLNELKLNVPILISECGNEPGWKSEISSQEMLNRLIGYDQTLQKYPQVKAATVFSYGNCPERWLTYNMDDTVITNGLIDYAQSTPTVAPEKPIYSFPGAGLPMKLYYAPNGILWKILPAANWQVDVYEMQGQWWRVTTGANKYWVKMQFV